MKKGYGVFGKAYAVMLKNDLHDTKSIDHRLLREMILLDEDSKDFLYCSRPFISQEIKKHELYGFAQQFKGRTAGESIKNILCYTSDMAQRYDIAFDDMLFGGTEKEIIERGTDWCADMARVGLVLLECIGIPARILHLANRSRAYYGHVVVEAFYEGAYGVLDFIYGYQFYDKKPLSAWELMGRPNKVLKLIDESADESYPALYDGIAVGEYDPMDPANDYTVSGVNEYCRQLLSREGDGWVMGEDSGNSE